MKSIATTQLSSKGQVVIPKEIRIALKLHTGDQFVVLGDKDVVIFKTIKAPKRQEFTQLILQARKQAQKTELTKQDVVFAIKNGETVKIKMKVVIDTNVFVAGIFWSAFSNYSFIFLLSSPCKKALYTACTIFLQSSFCLMRSR